MENKKHILISSSWYPSRVNKHVGNFVQRFAQLWGQEHQVYVVHSQADSTISEIEIIEETNKGVLEIIAYYPSGGNPLTRFKNKYLAFRQACEKIEHIDLIHGHVLLPNGFQFRIAKKQFKATLLVTEHGSYFRKEKQISLFKRMYLKWVLNSVDHFTAVSDFLKQDLLRYFPKKEIEILPNPIEVKDFAKSVQKEIEQNPTLQFSKPIEFLHISTLDEDLKNTKGIIDACKQLVKKGITNFHLQIVSDEETIKWETYVYSKKLGNNISFSGATAYEKIPLLYEKADAFILFSSYETFSIVLAESWAAGIPVISTPVGIAYSMDEKLGVQIGIGQTKELIRAMETIINKKQLFDSDFLKTHALQFDNFNVLKQLNSYLTTGEHTEKLSKQANDKKRSTPSSRKKVKRKNKRARKSA
jgi:L-malate glycosyltransferase